MSRDERARNEKGSALVELTWLGILLLIPMLWIVLGVFQVQKGAFGVSGAARAAGRAYALAPSDALGEARAQEAARQALADQGLRGVPLTVTVSCTPYPHNCHQGTSVVTVRVATRVDLPLLPDVLGGGAPSFALDASHTVPIGQYQEVDACPRRSEHGQATVLIVGFAVLLAMVVALVVDTSAAYLQRQGLDTLADGAALRGADLGATGEDVYQGGVPQDVAGPDPRAGAGGGRRLPRRGRRLHPLSRASPTRSASTATGSRSACTRPSTCRSPSPARPSAPPSAPRVGSRRGGRTSVRGWTTSEFSVATFNLYNFQLPGLHMNPFQKPWTKDEFNHKVSWVARMLDTIDADVIGLQELWNAEAMETVLDRQVLEGKYDLLATPATGSKIVCAALVRKGLLSGTPKWVSDVPRGGQARVRRRHGPAGARDRRTHQGLLPPGAQLPARAA